MRSYMVAVAACAALTFQAGPAFAQQQEQEEPETRVITITTFKVPLGKDLEDFWAAVDKYAFPSDKENPHILSERLASHYWGDNNQTVWFITEYENLAAIEEAERWTEERFDKQYPEGSPRRKTADADFQQKFLRHFSGHVDSILLVSKNRMK
jgi:hypothetical protein